MFNVRGLVTRKRNAELGTGTTRDEHGYGGIVPTAGGTRSWRTLGQAEAEHEDRQPAADCIREWRAGRRHQR